MKVLTVFSLVLLFSCNSEKNRVENVNNEVQVTVGKEHFFPVTSYIKGQIFSIKEKGINPIIYITENGKTDSAWLKLEQLDSVFADFLHPQIDTTNMKTLFREDKFLDQTINAYTFTYEPFTVLPDSLTLRHWDLYVDPTSNQITRVYMVKQEADKHMQLTWQNNQWSKVVTILTDKDGKAKVEKETFIKWDF